MALKIPVKKPAVAPIKTIGFGVRPLNSMAAREAAKEKKANPIMEEPSRETGDPKTVSVRLPPSHFAMLEDIKSVAECDKSEAIKKSLRLMANALSAHSSVLTLTDSNGNETTIPIMVRGRPA